jgi:hypothetical protein
MMPLALWWRDPQADAQEQRKSHLDNFYEGMLSGHNDADPVSKDCHHLEKLPRLRREAISNYSGIRIDSQGRRFRIEGARLWTLRNEAGEACGQAACFESWWWL